MSVDTKIMWVTRQNTVTATMSNKNVSYKQYIQALNMLKKGLVTT